MLDPQIQPDPLEVLADEFVARCRRGESPSVSEFADRHRPHAEQIRSLFPAIAMMEDLRAAKNAEHENSVRRADWLGVPPDLGDLEIIREIARGGMGIVFEAQQHALNRRVAVKVLPNHALLREKDLKRFRQEAQTAAGLHHTNIVSVYGVGEHQGVHYYVMPLIRGVGLDEVIRGLRDTAHRDESTYRPRLGLGHLVSRLTLETYADTTREACQGQETGVRSASAKSRVDASPHLTSDHWPMVARVGVQAAQALGFAHAHGILHRDVKPGNLLVDTEGVVCVADFGLARALDQSDASHSGDALGTLRYMAPEQLAGNADARSDIYSLGLTLYELATLHPAFADSRDRARRRRQRENHSDGDLVRPAKLAPTIPRDLETVILKCLADPPSLRYQTADELAADLQRFLSDRPIHARRVSVFERVRRWGRRNPALAAVSVLAILLLFTVVVTAAIGYAKTRAAHARTTAALTKAEAHSELALDVLEGIYNQLSPDRFGICSDSHAEGDPCTVTPTGSHQVAAMSFDNDAVRVQPSPQSAMLLENLLGFYDRLAEQAADDCHVMLESAIASRRVGDIRQRLGQPELAEGAYRRTIEKLSAIAAYDEVSEQVVTELARNHNEIGNVRSACQDTAMACASHQQALAVLLEHRDVAGPSAGYRYELARTLYFLTNNMPSSLPGPRSRGSAAVTADAPVASYRRSDYRQQASGILETLVHQHPNAPGYRFLLALCRRPLRPVTLNSRDAQARQEAIEILEGLTAEYPDVADYRYELATTYAWLHVGLYPWQTRVTAGRDVEPALRKASHKTELLVEHNPSVPHYARSRAVILAKLGTVCWTNSRMLEAETLFQQAFETQDAIVKGFPDLPSHNRVFREFLRLRAAQVSRERVSIADKANQSEAIGNRLDTCIGNLTSLLDRPELSEDRLARFALREACSVRSSLP